MARDPSVMPPQSGGGTVIIEGVGGGQVDHCLVLSSHCRLAYKTLDFTACRHRGVPWVAIMIRLPARGMSLGPWPLEGEAPAGDRVLPSLASADGLAEGNA